jgi:tetratricopeptide (TPR) repeat protein
MTSIAPILAAAVALGLAAPPQPPSVQNLFESGQYAQVLERVRAADAPTPQQLYLAGQSALKLTPPDDGQARTWFGRLGGAETDAWTFVGRSAVAVVGDDAAKAVAHGRKAVELAPASFHAQYQLGLALAEAKDYANGAAALEKATTLDPAFAYGHYYAGMAYYQAKRVDKMATFFERFLKLAPNAPERPAIESLMKSIRGK